jgi:hypothetical protein
VKTRVKKKENQIAKIVVALIANLMMKTTQRKERMPSPGSRWGFTSTIIALALEALKAD